MNKVSLTQILYIIREILSGLRCLFEYFGSFKFTDNQIMFN